MKLDVLMVDDEESLVWSTGQQLARERPAISFEGFNDPEAALRRIGLQPPDLLITDVRMPKMSGLELTLAARAVQPELPVIVITAYGAPEVLEAARSPRTAYLEKPFAFAQLLEKVDGLLSREGFSGAVSLTLLPDLIQIYTLSMANGALSISRAGRQGTIWFEKGQMVHAVLEGERGEAAVQQLLAWKGGAFNLDPRSQPPERTITASWQEVLLEACRLMDESASAGPDRLDVDGEDPGSIVLATESAPTQPAPTRDWRQVPETLGWPPLDSFPRLFPAATVVVRDLATGDGATLSGDPEGSPGDQVEAICGQAARIAGAERGSLEWAAPGRSGVVVWDRRAGVAMLVCEPVAGAIEAGRFRSRVIRANQIRVHRSVLEGA